MLSFDPAQEQTAQQYKTASPPEQDRLFRDAIWSAMLTILRAYGRRYGYCVDIEIRKVAK